MKVEWYYPTECLTFVLTPTKIIVKTKYQTNLIVYAVPNYKTKWLRLREKIQNNEIDNMLDLLDYCGARIGGVSQIQGLILIPTELERHI